MHLYISYLYHLVLVLTRFWCTPVQMNFKRYLPMLLLCHCVELVAEISDLFVSEKTKVICIDTSVKLLVEAVI